MEEEFGTVVQTSFHVLVFKKINESTLIKLMLLMTNQKLNDSMQLFLHVVINLIWCLN